MAVFKVIKDFYGEKEDRFFVIGDTLETSDSARIEVLRGYDDFLTEISEPKAEKSSKKRG